MAKQVATAKPFDSYLALRNLKDRMAYLKELYETKRFLPLSLVSDLIHLDLSVAEQIALLKVTQSSQNIELEHFFTTLMSMAHQDVAVCALHEWVNRTDQLLWFRLVAIAQAPHISQRIRYSMLDAVTRIPGGFLLSAYTTLSDLEEYSPAFHGLLFQKAVHYGFSHPRFEKLALHVLKSLAQKEQANEKSLPSAITYIARFTPKNLEAIRSDRRNSDYWATLIDCVCRQLEASADYNKSLGSFLQTDPKKAADEELQKAWPNLLGRHALTEATLAKALQYVARHQIHAPLAIGLFRGVSDKALVDALLSLTDATEFALATKAVDTLLDKSELERLTAACVAQILRGAAPEFIGSLGPKLKIQILMKNNMQKAAAPAAAIQKDEEKFIKAFKKSDIAQILSAEFQSYLKQPPEEPAAYGESMTESADRKNFFDLAYRGQTAATTKTEGYFGKLIQTWNEPTLKHLEELTPLSRKAPAFLQLCFLKTMGRFVGENEAALKLLDFVRTDEELELRYVVQALHGIGTPRATQELVSTITRPNTSPQLQMEICNLLADMNLAGVQGEIRSAISDINPRHGMADTNLEVKEALEALLVVDNSNRMPSSQRFDNADDQSKDAKFADLDASLSAKIPAYTEMSSEVRRALRTAEFFYLQVSGSNSHTVIDLSPVIDMQYKALELTFRELFEEPCKQVIQTGVLQRKLDVIGYARPIEQQMNQFENFIANLPVISTIPFFSKFKLRKMLRAICQFRPGRRFTLDGLKAFGLFFLCFGRKECNYGLKNIFPLALSDQELAEFCKRLHVFQDFRNRAAHEGFQPEASRDIEDIWRTTAEISTAAFKIKHALKDQAFVAQNAYEADDAVKGYRSAQGAQIVHKKVS